MTLRSFLDSSVCGRNLLLGGPACSHSEVFTHTLKSLEGLAISKMARILGCIHIRWIYSNLLGSATGSHVGRKTLISKQLTFIEYLLCAWCGKRDVCSLINLLNISCPYNDQALCRRKIVLSSWKLQFNWGAIHYTSIDWVSIMSSTSYRSCK